MAQFGYPHPPSQLIVSTVPGSSSSPSFISTLAGTTAPISTPSEAGAPRCCETGRPILTDPITGQTICSCQYDPQTHLLNYQRLGLQLYGSAYPDQAYLSALAGDQSSFYPPTAAGLDLKDNLSAAASAAAAWPYSMYYPYDTALAGYPFNGYGMDLNGARRKNATRETTSTLKAWLNEHKKNPYPTKGEKIMLAIITKMTLTQVSTWFANARRRLKKENKMTWEPRNRVDDEDGLDDDDVETKDGKDDDLDKGDDISKIGRNDDHPRRESHEISGGRDSPHTSSNSPISVSRSSSPVPLNFVSPGSASSTHVEETSSHQKPRIWSIVDTATSGTPSLGASAFTAPGKLLPSLAGHHRVSPYARPFPGEGPGVSVSSSETFLGAYAKTLQSFPGLGSIPPFSLTSSLLKPPPGLLNGFLAHAGPPSVSSSGNSANINPHLHSTSGLPTKLPHSLSVTSK